PWDRYFKGAIDEVEIWNAARSQAAIQGDMFRKLTGSEPGLAAYWRFEENGASVQDLTGHGNSGYLGSIVTTQPAWPVPGPGLMFDGADDFVVAPDSSSLDLTTTFTLEARIKPRNIAGKDRAVISKVGGPNGNNGYLLVV